MIVDQSDTRARILRLQQMLRYFGMVRGEPGFRVPLSGAYNEGTEQAVRLFQEVESLPVTGVTDRRTWERLTQLCAREKWCEDPVTVRVISDDPDASDGPGDRGENIRSLQLLLDRMSLNYGFPPPAPTGVYDEATEAAVRRVQEINGLPVTGVADRATWQVIAEAAG